MKKIIKYFLILVVVFTSLNSCHTDAVQEGNSLTAPQVSDIDGAVQLYEPALESYFNVYNMFGFDDISRQVPHNAFGYPAMMIMRDLMGQDMALNDSIYNDWFEDWYQVTVLGSGYLNCQVPWTWYYKQNYQANLILNLVPDTETASEKDRISAGKAHFYRAFAYFDLARLYQSTYAGNEEALTVPIVLTGTDVVNNPRVPNNVIYPFILEDLEAAKLLLETYVPASKTGVNLNVIHGLMARVYLTMENWEKAEEYAILAQGSYVPLTEAQWLDKTTGFNSSDNNSWMWCLTNTLNDDVVKTGIINWVSHMSNEFYTGYCMAEGVGTIRKMDAHLYSLISTTDFRRRAWIAPGTPASEINTIDPADNRILLENPYASIKFRPGSGNRTESSVAASVDIPLMRVEEMMLIEAEAAGMQDLTRGKALLEAFVRTRDPQFTSQAASDIMLQDEVWVQRRIELWGEGFATFDIKRLKKPIIRSYAGTNHLLGCLYNTETVPVWMNYVIISTETDNNLSIPPSANNPEPVRPSDSPEHVW